MTMWDEIFAERAALADDLSTLTAEQWATPSDTLRQFRDVRTSRTKAPIPVVAMLGEAVVHGEDIRRPLGIRRDYPTDVLARLAEFYSGSDLMVPSATRARDLRLRATDGDFTRGDGPEVTGSTLALVMALAGRDAYLAELDGPGLTEFAARRPG